MIKFLRFLAVCFFITSIAVLVISSIYRTMKSDGIALEIAWEQLEQSYEDRIQIVIDAESVFTNSSGTVVIGTGFARKTQYELRFESDKTIKTESLNRFETQLASVYNQINQLENKQDFTKIDRFLLLLSTTEGTVLTARDAYNLEIRRYNARLALFPRNIFADVFNKSKQGLLSMQIAKASL